MLYRAVSLLLLLLANFTPPLDAQRSTANQRAALDAPLVRAELAGVLLQSRRYDEAAREYQLILGRYPGNFAARLGLARALAWGKRPREAERELRMLRAQRYNHREVETLLRSVRESLEPRSSEARAWVAEEPAYVPYQRTLARALIRERKSEEAAQLLRRMLQRMPGDTALRHSLAGALAGSREYDAALTEYNSFIADYPSAALLLERAQLHVARRDLAAAEVDARASLDMRTNLGAYLLFGDLRRWSGDFDGARTAYNYARMMGSRDAQVSAAFAQLMRDERPVAAFMPSENHAPGWHLRSTMVSDNEGLTYATLGARRAVDLALGVNGSVEVEFRHLGQQLTGSDANIPGFAFGVGLSREFAHGPLLAQITSRGGLVHHSDASTLAGAAGITTWLGAWGLALEYGGGPAYPSLLTAASLRSPETGHAQLMETVSSAAIGGPLGRVDVAFSAQRAVISDDNTRLTVQLAARYPLTPHVSAITTGTGIWFTERSPLYWDPSSYVAAAAGLELAMRRTRGLSLGARVLGGPARTVEDVLGDPVSTEQAQTSLQFNGGLDVNYRSASRDFGAAVNYGSGRAGAYRRLEASVYVSLLR